MDRLGLFLARAFFATIGGAPLLVLAAVLARVWFDPAGALGGNWLRAASLLVMIEFLLLHSGAFMAVGPIVCPRRWQRLLWFLGFGSAYAGGLVMFARWSANDYVFWLLVGVVTARLMTLVVLHDRRGTILMLQRSAIGMIVLLLTAMVCFIPWPDLGITEALRYQALGEADDWLTRYPQRFIAWGIAYYTLMGVVEIVAGWNMPDWTEAQVEDAWRALQGKDKDDS